MKTIWRVLLAASVVLPIVALVALLMRTPPGSRPPARRSARVAIAVPTAPIQLAALVASAEAAVEMEHSGAQVWLAELEVAALDVDGVVHLARGPVELAFMVRPPHDLGWCYQLRLDSNGWTEGYSSEEGCEAGVAMRCSIDEIWRRAIAAGASRDGIARVRLYARRSDETREGAELWQLSMAGGSELTFPDDCPAPAPEEP